ncbi:MAG: RAMP superfamily CRISPR-associated protein [Clostridium sp.]|nr:RAMP superfamily CRISPR-associated protein [Acetatifactor muris]MCM1527275.1 RAMP superfamily CRISPR-associated protein [Bacteroides sp.]MCM1563031.1 RAMP superfamily CRISPR-associated protein [Clostridium sp.]
MGKLHGRLKIELMSDLCVGSGYSYAGVIDTDVCYDVYGIPNIPARRLKGCMREAAGLVCPDSMEALFGRAGAGNIQGIVLENAYIENYEAIIKELRELRDSGCREARYLSPQNILDRYTRIRAQVAINEETGKVRENSLRYTRVVGQYDPRKEGENLCFYAEVEYEENLREQLERIAKAVRNLGMYRNRGLGSVRCSLIAGREPEEGGREHGMESRMDGSMESSIKSSGSQVGCQNKGEGKICLTYVIRNREPLLMSSGSTGVSDAYISGRRILGTLAGAYLRGEKTSAESEEFRELFLDGTTIFTDANITFPPEEGRESADHWPAWYPAPLFLNRLKKTKALVNLLGDQSKLPEKEAALYHPENGNQPKKLKAHYVHESEPNVFDIAEVDSEILYHNGRLEQLYNPEALSEGQYFRGCIYTDQRYVGLLKTLLESSRLSFGKSRTAQYGACELAAEVSVRAVTVSEISAETGESVAVVLNSDAAFLNETGYTVRYEEVKALIGERLGIPYDRTTDRGSILQTKELTGYNTTWNLRRPGIPGLKAGSVLVYTIPEGKSWKKALSPDMCFVGEGNREGCGEVRVLKCRDMAYAARQARTAVREDGSAVLAVDDNRIILQSILTQQLLDRLIFLYMKTDFRLQLTPSAVGRVSLMLQESLNDYRREPEKAFADFCRRIDSIKRVKVKRETFRLLDRLMRKESGTGGPNELDIDKMADGAGDGTAREIRQLLCKHCGTDEEYRERLLGIWGVYMEQILAYHIYLKKHEGGNGDEQT